MKPMLLPVKLMGTGTADVESFPSYLHRIAYEHGVSVGVLMRFAVLQVRKSGVGTPTSCPQYSKVSELVRPDSITMALVDAFEKVTGQQLGSSILKFMQESLGSSSGEIVKGFRWCPECLKEMVKFGVPAYYKLIWHLKALKACPTHRTPLISACEHCENPQTGYRKKLGLDRCQECRVPLYHRRKPLGLDEISPSWLDNGFDMIRLFEDIARYPDQKFKETGVTESCEGLFEYYWSRGREREFYSFLDRDEYLSAIYYKKKISLLKARRIAFKLGVPLSSLLAGEGHNSPEFLEHRMFCQLPRGYLDAKQKKPKDHAMILRNIRLYIKCTNYPPTVKQVSKAVGVSVGYINYRHPYLVAEIVRRHKKYQDNLRDEKIRQAKQLALEYFSCPRSPDVRQSRKHAYKTIRESSGLPKHLLKRSITDVYNGLFSDL